METQFTRIGEHNIGEMAYDVVLANPLWNTTDIKVNDILSKTHNLMQYTGLKDKNGKEIYEGDIVDFGVTTNIKEVVFDEESASFRVYEYLYGQGSSLAEKWFLDDCDEIEVIGNKFENPELLEKTNERKRGRVYH